MTSVRILYLLIHIIPTLFCKAQSGADTLNINIEFNGIPIVKKGLILGSEVKFYKASTNENMKTYIKMEYGDSSFLLIKFKKNHEILLGFRNDKPKNVIISKNKVRLTWPYLLGYFKLKYYCKPYSVSFQLNGGLLTSGQSIMNKKCKYGKTKLLPNAIR